MNIVFCTTCKGRVQHLQKTLPVNIANNAKARFVVLDYNDQQGLSEYINANHLKDLASGNLVYYQYKEPVTFHMAHAKNLAHRLGIREKGDILVNLDADNFTGTDFDDYITDHFRDEGVFMWSRMVKEGVGRLTRGISGRIVVSREAFLLVGGYDQKYRTYSPDDKDFNARLRNLGLHGREIDPKYLQAILHNDKMRFKEYPEAASNLSCGDFRIDNGPIIANEGAVGCGLVVRNFNEKNPIYVGPIATRIFGIGMHKTATTSLHHALNILGIKCAHWPSAHWAKAVWREMNEIGRSPHLERFYACTDLPMPLLFRKLDKAYPGSKFILTVRDEQKWLKSVEKHWSDSNAFRSAWDNDPFSNRVHQVLYGRTDFDADTFLARYRRHNAEVIEHFKDRPDDLLVMQMDHGAGWKELCGFLQVQIPSEIYPKRYASLQD